MNTSEYAAVAAVHSVDPDRWWTEFSAVIDRVAPRFARYEPVRHAAELMAGMVSGLDRKNCWTIAEHRGDSTPDGLQYLLARAAVRAHGLGYVLAVAANRRVPTHAGAIRVDRLPAQLPKRAWQKHSAGAGSHGLRMYSWAWIALLAEDDADTGHHHLLIRRNNRTGELAYLRCYSPRPVTLHTLVAVAGHPDWSDCVDRQRVSPTLRRPARRHQTHPDQPAGLVTLATTTPIPSPTIPLPTT